MRDCTEGPFTVFAPVELLMVALMLPVSCQSYHIGVWWIYGLAYPSACVFGKVLLQSGAVHLIGVTFWSLLAAGPLVAGALLELNGSDGSVAMSLGEDFGERDLVMVLRKRSSDARIVGSFVSLCFC